jgi:hypothetical protein
MIKNVIVGYTSYNKKAFFGLETLFVKKNQVKKEKQFTEKQYGSDVNDKIGAFAIYMGKNQENFEYLEQLLIWATEEGLTLAGYQKKFRTYRDISDLHLRDFVTVALSDKYDIDYKVNRSGSKTLNGVKTYHITKDWNTIRRAMNNVIREKNIQELKRRPNKRTYREMALASLDTYVQKKTIVEKERKPKLETVEMNVFPHYIQVGRHIYPKNPNDVIVNYI